jgi:hypothetical protein
LALPPATPVLEDVDTLIMSPALFAQHPIRVPADVEGHVPLAGETRPGDWIDWLEAAGQSHLVARPRRVFDHFFITRQVVEDGLGLGIGPPLLLEIDVASVPDHDAAAANPGSAHRRCRFGGPGCAEDGPAHRLGRMVGDGGTGPGLVSLTGTHPTQSFRTSGPRARTAWPPV